MPAILIGGTPAQRSDNQNLIKLSNAFNKELSALFAGCRQVVQELTDVNMYDLVNDPEFGQCFASGFQLVIIKEHKDKASETMDILSNISTFLGLTFEASEKFQPCTSICYESRR